MTDLADFLMARIADDEAATFELVPYRCEPGCCAPAGFVGHRCLICGTEEFGGTVDAITDIAREHDEKIHRRSRVLAECDAKRRIVAWHRPTTENVEWFDTTDPAGEAPVCPSCRPKDPTDWHPAVGKAGIRPEGFVASYTLAPCPTLRLLALPYADHPDYREEWKP